MNPPKSLMALGAAIVVAAPCVARADSAAGEWLALKTRPQSYFVHNVEPDSVQYAKMRKQAFRGPIALWVDEKQKDGTLKKVESGATLDCAYREVQKVKKWVCKITANAKDGGTFQIAVDIGAEPASTKSKPAAGAEDAAAARPEGVSQDVWAAVVNSGKVPQAHWTQAAKDVEQALRQSPKGARMRAAGNAAFDKLLIAVEADIAAKKSDADIVKRAVDLTENIAPAPNTALPPPPPVAGAPVKDQGQPGKRVEEVDGANVINTLAKLLAKPEVQSDLSKRLLAYLTDPKGPPYVDAKGHEATAQAQLEKGLAAGVAKITADEKGRGRAAVLYFMLGEKEQKPWFKDNPELSSLVADQVMRGNFTEAMKIWTAAGAGTPGVANAGPYKGDAAWPEQLITDALDKADKVWADKRTKGEIKVSVNLGEQAPDVPGVFGKGSGGPGNNDLKNLLARSFDAKEMYLNGAKVAYLPIPGSNPPAFRQIAIKIFSKVTGDKPDAWGPPANIVDQLAIYDVSDRSTDGRTPSNIFGQRFPLNQRGDSTFNLDDRSLGTVRYTLHMGPDGISFQAVTTHGKKPDEPVGEPMKTNINELYELRNKELGDASQSYLAEIGGQSFRVIPQGGSQGMLLYYPADGTGRAIGDSPALTTALSKVTPDGRTVSMRDKQPLGFIGNDFYWLKWNESLGSYEPVVGDKPKTGPDPSADTDKDKKPDAKKPGDGGGTAPDTGNTADNGNAGNTDNGDGGNADNSDTATTDPNVQSTPVTACTFGKTFGTSSFEHYRTQDSWKLFTDATIDPSDTNKTYLCLYKQYGIWLDGLIPKDKRALGLIGSESDGYIHVIVVKPAGGGSDASVRRITPGDAKNLVLKGDEVAFGKDTTRDIDSAIEYYIPLKGLKANIKASKGSAVASKVAWVEMHPDFLQGNVNPSMRVYLRPGDDVKAVLTKALVDHAQDTVCADANGPTPQLKTYIDAVAKDDSLKTELGKFDMTNLNSTPPSVSFACKAPLTAANGVWDVAQTSWWKSSNVLRTSGGKIDASSGYAKN